jgi:hypothetical protein
MYTKSVLQDIITNLKYCEKYRTGLIYCIYVKGTNNKHCVKIGKANSVDLFLKKDGRFDQHTKLYNTTNEVILLDIISCKQFDPLLVEIQLHRLIKSALINGGFDKKDVLAGLTKTNKQYGGNDTNCIESFVLIWSIYLKIPNVIYNIINELYPIIKPPMFVYKSIYC